MRRDYFTVDVQQRSEDDGPTIGIEYDGPSGELHDRLRRGGSTLDADDIDVTFRRQPDTETGVLSLTDRVTGEFILEVTADIAAMDELVETAQNHDGEYAVELTDDDGKSLLYSKETLLVYDHDGSLLRQRSLIPTGVEL